MDKIKIMHVVQGANGGVERYIQMLLKKIDDIKYENILVCSLDYDIDRYEGIICGIEQVDMCREIKVKTDFKAVLSVRRIIKKYNPDIVYAHSSKAGAVARIANIGLKSKCIYNPHGWAFNMRGCSQEKIKAYVLIEKVLSHFCSKIIAISDYEKESAIRNNICAENKINVIYNGIDTDEYTEKENKTQKDFIRNECKILENSFVIGCVGRLSEQKAPDVFVKAAHLIKREIHNAYFLMVGDGEQRQEIEELIKELELENCVYITGWVDNPIDYIERFNIAMLLSRWEGFGLVLPEYMLAGKPIVATDVDAISYVVGDAGRLVDVDDHKAASEAVISLYKDKKFREKYIEKGKERLKLFDAQRMADEHARMWESL